MEDADRCRRQENLIRGFGLRWCDVSFAMGYVQLSRQLEHQVPGHTDLIYVTGSGGTFSQQSALLLASDAAL